MLDLASRPCLQLLEPVWHRIADAVAAITLSPSFAENNAHYAAKTGDSADFEDTLRFVRGMALLGLRFFEEVVTPTLVRDTDDGPARSTVFDATPSFLRAAEALHAGLSGLAGPEGGLAQRAVLLLCETLWLSGLPDVSVLVPGMLPHLLLASLVPDSAKDADVKRVHAVRTALSLLEVDDDSFASIKELILLAFRSPLYLKCAEGRRFLSYALTLSPALTRDIHAVIKANAVAAPIKAAEAYGEVYFRAWRAAEGACRLALEAQCLQDYMQAAACASVPGTLKVCRRILDAWVQQKKQRGVDDVLLRCYNPILWRSLQAPNPDVRRCAPLSPPVAAYLFAVVCLLNRVLARVCVS